MLFINHFIFFKIKQKLTNLKLKFYKIYKINIKIINYLKNITLLPAKKN